MDIKLGEIYINKTWTYLMPCVNSFGSDFLAYYNGLAKLAVGIHDTLLDHSPLISGENIYILFDTSVRNTYFFQFLEWVREEEYFLAEYSFDEDITVATKHMVVINVPECHKEDYGNFLLGKYSKMYTEDFKKEHFLDKGRLVAYGVLSKDPTFVGDYQRQLQKEFPTFDIMEEDLKEHEVELPLKREEEVFNCKPEQRPFFNEKLDKVWCK